MKKLGIGIVVFAVALVVVAVPLYGQHRHAIARSGLDGFGPFERLRWLRQELDLTDAQVKQIRQIAFDVRDSNADARREIRTDLRQAARILLEDPANTAGAQSALSQHAATEAQMKANVLDGISKALAVLTPEQRTRLIEIMDQHSNGV